MLTFLNKINIGKLNTFLLFFTLLISFIQPFYIFVFAYALLGPLHYLTQLNWLNVKPVFQGNKSFKAFLIVLAIILSVITILIRFQVIVLDWKHLSLTYALIVCMALIVSAKNIFQLSKKQTWVVVIGVILLLLISYSSIKLLILLGVLVTSVVHVYLFTLLHMLNGALKQKSKIDLINSVFLFSIPILFFLIPEDLVLSLTFKSNQNIDLAVLSTNLSAFFGYPLLNPVSYQKFAWFISFSYLYHYLNWFSKTKIIQWDNDLTRKKTIVLSILALFFSSIYLLGFEYGLLASLFLSYLHVFSEFPINFTSISGIVKNIKIKKM